jgi:membrane dipeptidase
VNDPCPLVLLAHDHFLPPDDLAALRSGGVHGKILMATLDAHAWADRIEDYQDSIHRVDGCFESATRTYAKLSQQIESSSDYAVVRTSSDIEAARRSGRIAIVLGAEGGKIVEDRLGNLESLYRLGLRHLMLTWAFDNPLSAGELNRSGTGLTPLGREAIREMNRLGLVLDTTHLSRTAMGEALSLSTQPVINSHTCSRRLSNRVPTLNDDEVRAVAETGGVVALHFMTHMLTGRFEPRATLDEVVDQIDALVDAGGVDCVALGPDYLPYTESFKRNTGQRNLSFPEGLESPAGLPALTRRLEERGYSEVAIRKILGENLVRLLRATIG